MVKNVQMSVKMNQELHDQFMSAAAAIDVPAAQVIRLLMQKFIVQQKIPNEVTIAAMEAADKGKGVRFNSAEDLFKDLGI